MKPGLIFALLLAGCQTRPRELHFTVRPMAPEKIATIAAQAIAMQAAAADVHFRVTRLAP